MKQHGNKDYEFKGWDWTELAEYFGCDGSDEESAKAIDEKLVEIIGEIHGYSLQAHPDVKKIREFVSIIHTKDNTYKKPIWKGLSNIKEDGTFLKFVSILYREMWN
jgi:hypothetical protein